MEPLETIDDRYDNWYGMDTENDKTGKVTLVALIHESGEKWIWKEAGKFKEWCERQKGKSVVICHNLEYDLINEFTRDGMSWMQLNYLKGRLISAKYHNITFFDSFNHFRMKLAHLGDAIGIKKQTFDIYDEDYVTTDAWICLKSMTMARDFISSLGGQIGATSGSSSVSVWRAMTDGAYELGPVDTPWFREGYYGGRTELFAREIKGDYKGYIKGYDVNSMYPFVMLESYPEAVYKDDGLDKHKGMAEVTIAIPEDLQIGPIVYRDPKSKRLVYPVGLFRGTWTYDEIKYAEAMGGRVIKVHRAYGGNLLLDPFRDFILTCYERRKQTKDPAFRLFYKVLMNSLYGKIASKNVVTRAVSRQTLVKNGGRRIDEVRWINTHRGLLEYKTPPQKYVNMVWGSMVTAYSRLLLTKYMFHVGAEKLIYGDTDSIYCYDAELPTGPEIGQMKLEKELKYMKVLQKKVYQIDDEYTAKGVPKPKFNDETGEMIFDFAKEFMETGSTEFEAPVRFIESIRSRRGEANEWIKRKKSIKSLETGKRVSGNRYLPPVAAIQGDMFDPERSEVVIK